MDSPKVTYLAAGVVIGGGYRILRPLAEGGMGTVYEAEQTATGAKRALKIMHGHFARDESLRARFVREARLAELPAHAHASGTRPSAASNRSRPALRIPVVLSANANA